MMKRWNRIHSHKARLVTIFGLAAVLLLGQTGCARYPSGVSSQFSGTQLIVTMTVAGAFDPNGHYFVLFNPTNQPSTTGPIPVVGEPWGNGFATGNFTAFLRYDPGTNSATMWGVQPGTNQLSFYVLPAPTQFSIVTEPNGTQLQFQIPLSEIPNGAALSFLQFNFIATDSVPVTGAGSSTTKLYDALGDGRVNSQINSPVTMSTSVSGEVSNTGEPSGDVMLVGSGIALPGNNEPDSATVNGVLVQNLDIVGYSITVRADSQ